MTNYTAWINGGSVAHGTLKHCKEHAKHIVKTERWQARNPGPAEVKITRGPRQLFAAAFIVDPLR